MMLFAEKIKDDKSLMHIDTTGAAILRNLKEGNLEKKFTTMAFLMNLLTMIATETPNCNRFIDILEESLCPEMIRIFFKINDDVTRNLDIENRKYKYNICILIMMMIRSVMQVSMHIFTTNIKGDFRSFDKMTEQLNESDKVYALCENYYDLDFLFFENNIDYLEIGTRKEGLDGSEVDNLRRSSSQFFQRSTSMSQKNMSQKNFFQTNLKNTNDQNSEITAILSKMKETRMKLISVGNSKETEDTKIDNFDKNQEEYSKFATNLVQKSKPIYTDLDENTKSQIQKENEFGFFLMEELPKFFGGNEIPKYNVLIQEIKKNHDATFGKTDSNDGQSSFFKKNIKTDFVNNLPTENSKKDDTKVFGNFDNFGESINHFTTETKNNQSRLSLKDFDEVDDFTKLTKVNNNNKSANKMGISMGQFQDIDNSAHLKIPSETENKTSERISLSQFQDMDNDNPFDKNQKNNYKISSSHFKNFDPQTSFTKQNQNKPKDFTSAFSDFGTDLANNTKKSIGPSEKRKQNTPTLSFEKMGKTSTQGGFGGLFANDFNPPNKIHPKNFDMEHDLSLESEQKIPKQLQNSKINNPNDPFVTKLSVIPVSKNSMKKSNFNDLFLDEKASSVPPRSVTGRLAKSIIPGQLDIHSSMMSKDFSDRNVAKNQEKMNTVHFNFNHGNSAIRDSNLGIKDQFNNGLTKEDIQRATSNLTSLRPKQSLSNPPSIQSYQFEVKPKTEKKNDGRNNQTGQKPIISFGNISIDHAPIGFDQNRNPAPFTAVYENGLEYNRENPEKGVSRNRKNNDQSPSKPSTNIRIGNFQETQNDKYDNARNQFISQEKTENDANNRNDFQNRPLVQSIVEFEENDPSNQFQANNSSQKRAQQNSKTKRIQQSPETDNWGFGFNTDTTPNEQENFRNSNLNQNRFNQPTQNQFDSNKTENNIRPARQDNMSNNNIDSPIKNSNFEKIQLSQDPQLNEYKKAIEKYEMFIKNYQKEINDLKVENKQLYDQNACLNEKNKELESDKIQLSTQISSLKRENEHQSQKHRNQMIKLQDDVKKQNEPKMVAREQAYNKNLQKMRVEFNSQIISLHDEINSLTIEKEKIAASKKILAAEKQSEFISLKENIQKMREELTQINTEFEIKSLGFMATIQDKKSVKNKSTTNQGNLYDQLLLEKKKNMELARQLLISTNEIGVVQNNQLEKTMIKRQEKQKWLVNEMKRNVNVLRTLHQKSSLAVMGIISEFQRDVLSVVKNQQMKKFENFSRLTAELKQRDQEINIIKFQNDVMSSESNRNKSELKTALEELQKMKKLIIDKNFLDLNNMGKPEKDIEASRKNKTLEVQYKELNENHQKVVQELMNKEKMLLAKESEFIPATTHYMIVKKLEEEVSDLDRLNQNLIKEFRLINRYDDGVKQEENKSKRDRNQYRSDMGFEDKYRIANHQSNYNAHVSGNNSTVVNNNNDIVTFTKGSALLQKTNDIYNNMDRYQKDSKVKETVVEAIMTYNDSNKKFLSIACSQSKYCLIRNNNFSVNVEEKISFIKNSTNISLELKFRNLFDQPIKLYDLHIETTSKNVFIEEARNEDSVELRKNDSFTFVLNFEISGAYYSEPKPIFMLFQSSIGQKSSGVNKSPYSQVNLDDFYKLTIPLTMNKLLQTVPETIEKFSVIKTLKKLVDVDLACIGTLNYKRLLFIFPTFCLLNEDEGIYGQKVLSPQGIFFIILVGKKTAKINVKFFGMFSLKLFDETIEVLEFIFKNYEG